jgi:hypothetical protein
MQGQPIGQVEGPIQIIPQGMMGLLQLKQLGKLPGDLSMVVEPSLEMRDWYMQARQLNTIALFGSIPTTANFVTGANGFAAFQVGGADFTIPQGQCWYVEAMTTIVSTNVAADTIRFAPSVQSANPGALTEFFMVGPDVNDAVTAQNRVLSAKADRAFWMTPGMKFGISVFNVIYAVNAHGTLHVRATPMPL